MYALRRSCVVGNGSVGKMQWAAYVLHALGKSCVVGINWVGRMLQWIGAAFTWSAGISLLPGAVTTKEELKRRR